MTVTMHDDLAECVYVLEAKDEIRRLMAGYVHARDFADSSIDQYFTDDAVWEGVDEQVRRRWPHLADILGPQVGPRRDRQTVCSTSSASAAPARQ